MKAICDCRAGHCLQGRRTNECPARARTERLEVLPRAASPLTCVVGGERIPRYDPFVESELGEVTCLECDDAPTLNQTES